MEVTACVAATHGVSQPLPSSQSLRKEWRAVSEHSLRNGGTEDSERSKIAQIDERTIYEVREPADLDFCSIIIDGGFDNDIAQQRLHSVAVQREDLQRIEIELRAQLIARSQIVEIQSTFDAQIKEHANANIKLQEQLHEREQTICELERQLEEKEKELLAIKLDNQVAWAKEDLLREQNKELATFRRERDNSEAERAQRVKQIHEVQEHIQEKERQFMELQEQHRIAQETIIFKDERLREAEAWIRRVQEMDALQSTTLQTELRERTEQLNQLWHASQRQFADMERLHLHALQQLQLELADARERNGTYPDQSHKSQASSVDVSQFEQSSGSELEVNGSSTPGGNSGILPNGNAENVTAYASAGNASNQTEQIPVVPIAPPSLLGIPTYVQAGQMTALHPFVMHQPGVPHSVPSHVTQSHVGHFHSVPPISPLHHWQNQQVASEGSQILTNNQYPQSRTEQNFLRPDAKYDFEGSVDMQGLLPNYSEGQVSQGLEPDSVIQSSAEEGQLLQPMDKSYLVAPQSQQDLQYISSHFHDALRLDPLAENCETKEKSIINLTDHEEESQGLTAVETSSVANASSEIPNSPVNFSETTVSNASGAVLPEAYVSSGQKIMHKVGETMETNLVDERSLLSCIVRTIPPVSGGRIRISSTLPNRLGKMLAPLLWHDYKKKYGKLDDFVAGHPELFVIEGDYIMLREGAQEIIAATAAVAKVAAAAAASSPYSALLPSVAVTPMAQAQRLKRTSSTDSNSVKSEKPSFKDYAGSTPANATENPSQISAMQSQHLSGVCFNVAGVGNGAVQDSSLLSSSQSKGSTQGRHGTNFVGKQRGRTTLGAPNSRR